jgi:hypothetical protein
VDARWGGDRRLHAVPLPRDAMRWPMGCNCNAIPQPLLTACTAGLTCTACRSARQYVVTSTRAFTCFRRRNSYLLPCYYSYSTLVVVVTFLSIYAWNNVSVLGPNSPKNRCMHGTMCERHSLRISAGERA